MAQCPGYCGLKSFTTNHRGYTCDSCGKTQALYNQMWGCRSCNFDLCTSCYSAKNNFKKGSSSKMSALFDKSYGDPEDPEIMSESGMLKFFKDCGANPDGYEPLVVSYHLQTSEMGIYEKAEFVKGFVDSGCSTKKEIKNVIQNRIKAVGTNNKEYKKFYKWLFVHVKEEEKKKTIPTELAIQLWTLVFSSKQSSMPLLAKWIEFCGEQQDKDLRVISRDVWEQIYDFLVETQRIEDYDDAGGAWPVAVDEFVEWIQEQK